MNKEEEPKEKFSLHKKIKKEKDDHVETDQTKPQEILNEKNRPSLLLPERKSKSVHA